jgi:YesN/AraC family two-component response regulator
MMRIVLVEDEPSAMRYIKSIIELRCSGFKIVDTAENGAEGLEKVRLLKPDVVITDIKMPVMDGIELVSHIKEEFPFIYSVIVSGYQDFEYAKGAIQSGVVDYLLKPVNAGQLKKLLDSIRQKLETEYYIKRVGLLKHILIGAPAETWQVEKYLPFKCYSAAILRENGLPSRFSSKHTAAAYNPAVEAYAVSCTTGDNSIWVLTGRDERELLFFCTPELTDRNAFESLVAGTAEKLTGGYHTTIFASEFFGLLECKNMVSNLYRTLDNNIVIGLSQTIYELPEVRSAVENRASMDGSLGNKIAFLVSNAMYDGLKQELIKLFGTWEKERRTQLWVESNLRQILHHVEKHSAATRGGQNYDIEFLLDEALYYSTTFGELMANIWELVEKIVQCVEKKDHKVDTPAFFNSIEQYLEQNLSEPLSLQSVCSVFGISQTYLSRLFRKYKNMSFNEYLTAIRIDEAKRLIIENPNIPLKDVAMLVGYNDQFYFSRVFRSVTGVPPSEYILKSPSSKS